MSEKIDRESVKVLAIAVGVREAARQLGLNEDRVRQWSCRYKWLVNEDKPQPPTVTKNLVTTVTKPSDALRSLLEDDNRKTKLGLSRATRKAAETLQGYHGERVIKNSRQLKDIVGAASQIHQWEKEEEGSGVMSGLKVYSNQTVINVQTHEDAREGRSDSKAISE